MGKQLKAATRTSPTVGATPASQTNGVSEADGPTNRLISAQELAMRLGVPDSWVYSAARRGIIPSVKVGKYRRFDYEEVRRAIDEWKD